MAYTPSNPNGQATSANSAPVVIASDQSSIAVTVSGVATAANQTTQTTSLQLLDDVVATDGSAALTKLYQVGGTDGTNAQILSTNVSGHLNIADGGNSITIDGTVTANAGTGSFTVAQATAANLNATVVGTGTFAVQAAQSGNYVVRNQDGAGNNLASSTTAPAGTEQALIVRNIPSGTQTISGTVTANAGTGTMNVSVQNASIPVTDNGSSLTVDGSISVSNFPATQVVSATNLDIRDLTATDVVTVTGGAGQTADVKITLDSEQVAISNFPATQTVSGTVTVQDGGSSITVDGTVAATQSGTWSTRTQDGAGNAVTSRTTGAARPFDVAIVDGSGNQVTSFGGGTEYADGTAVATPTGKAILGFDGANVQVISTNASGHINIADGGNTITVDGIVAATQSGTWNIGTLTSITNTVTVSGTVTADTELATAAALSDAAANPTTSTVGAATLGFNGTTWDRLKSEGTNADAEAVSTTGSLSVCSHSEVFNGTSWDRMRAASALDGTAATSHTGVLAVLQPGKRFDPANLGTAANSTSVIDVNGSNSISIGIETTTTGTFTIEATSDGINWGTPEVFDATADIWVSGTNITPTLGKTYQVLAGGFRSVRLRTVTTLGTTVAHAFNATMSQAFIGGIDTGAAPHNFGYAIFHAEGNYAATQTSVAIRTTTAGKKFAVTDITVSTDGTTAGVVTIYDASGTTAFSAGTTPSVFRASFAPTATVKPGATKHFPVPYVSTTAGNNILVTITGITASYIQINGYEI